MIRQFISVLAAICVAYGVAVWLGPRLPPVKIQTESDRPLSMPEILSRYLVRGAGERLHMLNAPRPAEWTNPLDSYVLYDLADSVSGPSENYAATGGSVESLYETLLLSLKQGDDPDFDRLRRNYLSAREKALSYTFLKKSKDARIAAQQKALLALLAYVDTPKPGVAPLALAKALRDYYGATSPKVRVPGAEERNYRSVVSSPPLASLIAGTTPIPTVDILVPATQQGQSPAGAIAVKAQQLRLAEVSLFRPWLDLSMLARTSGPWIGDDPKLFGPNGSLARVPIRLVLVERPTIETPAASVTSAASGSASAVVGPFNYAASEVNVAGNVLTLRPKSSQWLVMAVITREP